MTDKDRLQLADQAAVAARKAANEATDPEARFFLRQHANRLARIAAQQRLAVRRGAAERVGFVAPLVGLLPA